MLLQFPRACDLEASSSARGRRLTCPEGNVLRPLCGSQCCSPAWPGCPSSSSAAPACRSSVAAPLGTPARPSLQGTKSKGTRSQPGDETARPPPDASTPSCPCARQPHGWVWCIWCRLSALHIPSLALQLHTHHHAQGAELRSLPVPEFIRAAADPISQQLHQPQPSLGTNSWHSHPILPVPSAYRNQTSFLSTEQASFCYTLLFFTLRDPPSPASCLWQQPKVEV